MGSKNYLVTWYWSSCLLTKVGSILQSKYFIFSKMINFKFCMLEFDQNILSKIRMSNISWFQNNKKIRNTHGSMKWWFNPKTKWWLMRFHKKIIDDTTLFSDFSHNHFCLVTAHWSCLCSRWFIADTVGDNILHKTWFAFCRSTFTFAYWNSCNRSSLSSGLCRKKKAVFFFFCVPPRSSLDIKKDQAGKSTLNTIIKCTNHEQFLYTTKRLFRQFHFVEQWNLAVHMLRPLKHQNRFNNPILCFHTRNILSLLTK